MNEEYKDMLSPDHLERLAWFDDRTGQVVPWPDPVAERAKTGGRMLARAATVLAYRAATDGGCGIAQTAA